jgi:hypothetical protein
MSVIRLPSSVIVVERRQPSMMATSTAAGS